MDNIEIADTGLIVAFLSRRDPFHDWALRGFRNHAPFLTCDVVLAEAGSFFPDPVGLFKLVSRGDLALDPEFVLAQHLPRVSALVSKYTDRPMDIADACLVRMAEIHSNSRVWTVDTNDFQTYRKNEREPVPCVFPDS